MPYSHKKLTVDEIVAVIRLVESYVFRRAICTIPTNSMNTTFAGLSRTIQKENYIESLHAAFLLLPSYRRFPNDEDFMRDIKKRDLYNFRSRSYWLRRLENHGRKERVAVEEYTIEHIMPQNENLSKEWQAELGIEFQRIQQEWLHTIGNLTLTAYNSEYSDHSFTYKRQEITDKNGYKIGFAHSPLKLNNELRDTPVWNEEALKSRAHCLAQEAITVWRAPQLSSEVLDTYRPLSKSKAQYNISDHPQLNMGAMSELFDAFRKAILALDPCINEEFLKLYVAYKAETNFVDVIPQAKRLLLILNLTMDDIEDPKELCHDISGKGRWGNGDVEVVLNSLDELPYAIGLVRQSFDYQMGRS